MNHEMLELFFAPVAKNLPLACVTLCLIVFDVVVGFTNAAFKHEISSSKMREGLQRKTGSIFFMCAASVIDGALMYGVNLGFDTPVFTGVCIYISAMELISILENCVKLNPGLGDNPLIGGITKRLASDEGDK